jgi:dihydroneopterin aldolase
MIDTVFIRGLVLETVIGCYDFEKIQAQKISLDIEMAWDIRAAATSDQLTDTLDYGAVCERVTTLVNETECELLETLVERIAETIMKEFSVKGIRIRLAKPDIIENTIDVGVSISRGLAF